MVEKLQMSMSEATKKLSSERIQIDPILPETPNVCWDTNQENRQATVQLNIVEDDENVTSEPCCAGCLNLLIRMFFCYIVLVVMTLVVCFLIGGYIILIDYMFSLQTTASEIFGWILLLVILSWISSCIVFFQDSCKK